MAKAKPAEITLPLPTSALEARVKTLEASLQALSFAILHDAICWRCEDCGHANQMPRLFARHVRWACAGCENEPLDDYRRFYLNRRP